MSGSCPLKQMLACFSLRFLLLPAGIARAASVATIRRSMVRAAPRRWTRSIRTPSRAHPAAARNPTAISILPAVPPGQSAGIYWSPPTVTMRTLLKLASRRGKGTTTTAASESGMITRNASAKPGLSTSMSRAGQQQLSRGYTLKRLLVRLSLGFLLLVGSWGGQLSGQAIPSPDGLGQTQSTQEKARLRRAADSLRQALASSARVLEHDPDNAEAWLLLGVRRLALARLRGPRDTRPSPAGRIKLCQRGCRSVLAHAGTGFDPK